MAKKEVKKLLTLKEKMSTDVKFETACKKIDVEPTTRQYSKFLRGFGKVYRLVVLNHSEKQMQQPV